MLQSVWSVGCVECQEPKSSLAQRSVHRVLPPTKKGHVDDDVILEIAPGHQLAKEYRGDLRVVGGEGVATAEVVVHVTS